MSSAQVDYWNPNVHYQPVILQAVPAGCGAALEVGCGDGMLARRLAERCAEVTAIDRDARMITLARSGPPRPGRMTFVEADFLAYPLAAASFDFACANTALHHMDFEAALTAMARALRPGGCLAVVGLAADRSIGDYLAAAPALPVNVIYRALYRERNSGAPVKDPEMTWAEVRGAARRLLPGVRYRRHLLWRYSLRWTKPLLADVGGGAVGDAQEFGVRGGEHGVRVARRGPDHVVLVQPHVHQGPDRAGVAHRGDAADGLTRPLTDRTGVGSSHLRHAGKPRQPGGVHAVRAAGHDEERRPVRVEHQAVRDRAEFAAELGGRCRGGRRALRQFPYLARDA
jgi:SAM-dependent methyltransferase